MASGRIMLKRIVGVVGIASLGCSLALDAQAPATKPQGSPAATQRAVVTRYCVTCHNEKVRTAGLMLDDAAGRATSTR